MNYKRVAVVRGGSGGEYLVSMQAGKSVLAALNELEYSYKDIVITKKGEWLEDGFIRRPEAALEAVDVVFVALCGEYGEVGQVQRILERKNIPFTGSRSFSTAVAFNKELTKRTLKPYSIKMPRHRKVTLDELGSIAAEVSNIFSDLGAELFIKPVANGSSIGARYIPNEATLQAALTELLPIYEKVMVEEYIRGREATVAVLGNFRNEPIYALPVIEIIPPDGEPLSSESSETSKYKGTTEEVVPGRFSYPEKALLSDVARLAHEVIGCKHYSRSDFIVRNGEVYFLEINTLPGLACESLFPKATASVGLEYSQLIQHLVEAA